MLGVLVEILGSIAALSLLMVPGLVALALLPRRLVPPHLVPVAAFILSPGVVALELAMGVVVGLPFAVFAPAVAIFNVGAAALLVYRWPRFSLGVSVPWIVIALLVIVPILAVPLSMPLRREYGFHNMMQLAAIHGIYGLPRLPEELGLAGFRLNYGWLGWAQLATVAALTRTGPTLLATPLNILHFVCLFVLVCETASLLVARDRVPDRWIIAFGAGLALMAAGLLDCLGFAITAKYRAIGEMHMTPVIGKSVHMDLMAFGVSSLGLLGYALVRAARSRDIGACYLAAVAAGSACLLYPLFLPASISIVAAFACFCALAPRFPAWQGARYGWRDLGGPGLAWLICLAIVGTYIALTGQDASEVPVSVRPLSGLARQTRLLVWCFAIIDVLLGFIAYRAWRERSGSTLLLVAISFGLQCAYLIFQMPYGVEYKFIFVASIVSAPPIAAILAHWSSSRARLRHALVVAFGFAVATCMMLPLRWGTPALASAEPLDESTPYVHPSNNWTSSWLYAVRTQTPDDTVVLTGASGRPAAVFSARSLYVCADGPPAENGFVPHSYRAGYSMPCWDELHVVKGYAATEITRRRHTLQTALADRSTPREALAVMAALEKLARPVALHVDGPSWFLGWLRDRRIGRPIFASGADTVWLIERQDFGAAM